MGFNRLRVRTRIYLGFGAPIVLGLCLAVFGVYELGEVHTEVTKMDVLAGNTQRVLTVTRDLEAIRRAQTRYSVDASADALISPSIAKYLAIKDACAGRDLNPKHPRLERENTKQ